ncbi:MAG: GDSL-type esterase/lipase family protein [Dyella sp.]
MSQPPLLTYLALGDSYSIGEGVDEAARWPVQLTRLLGQHGHALAPPQIVACTGWSTDELADAIEQQTLTPPYDLVSLLIGVNNQYRGRALDNYREEFRALLARAINLAGGRSQRVLVLSIPDWGVTPFARREARDPQAIGQAIDRFNACAREETIRQGAQWVDITALSRAQPDLLTADGLHPAPHQYAHWALTALPVALAALG